MSSCFYGFPIVAYVSLALENDKTTALESVQKYCRDTSVETDIFAEEILPDEKHRPLWQKVIELIYSGNVSILIVPSLEHIAGNNPKFLSAFLTLLKIKSVRLKSLAEGIDSQRHSRTKILSRLPMAADSVVKSSDLH